MSNQISVDPVKLMHKSYVHMWTHTHTTHWWQFGFEVFYSSLFFSKEDYRIEDSQIFIYEFPEASFITSFFLSDLKPSRLELILSRFQ